MPQSRRICPGCNQQIDAEVLVLCRRAFIVWGNWSVTETTSLRDGRSSGKEVKCFTETTKPSQEDFPSQRNKDYNNTIVHGATLTSIQYSHHSHPFKRNVVLTQNNARLERDIPPVTWAPFPDFSFLSCFKPLSGGEPPATSSQSLSNNPMLLPHLPTYKQTIISQTITKLYYR